MGTISEQLQSIINSKSAIKTAIENKGVSNVGEVLENYAEKINEIPVMEDAPSDNKKYVRQNANWVEETTYDLSGLATKDELNGKADADHTHSEYLPLSGGLMSGGISFGNFTINKGGDDDQLSIYSTGNGTTGSITFKVGSTGAILSLTKSNFTFNGNQIYHEGNFIAGTNYVEPSTLSDYALTSTLDDYVLTSALSSYATKSELNAYLPLSGGLMNGNIDLYDHKLEFRGNSSLENYISNYVYDSTSRAGDKGWEYTIGIYTGTNRNVYHISNETNIYKIYDEGNFISGTDYVAPSTLSNYVTTTTLTSQLATKANTSHTHTSSQVSGLATVATSGSYDDLTDKPTIPSLTGYATQTWVTGQGYLTSIPSEYITETELNAKGYLTSIPSQYITESELTAKGYQTATQVQTAISELVDSAPEALNTLNELAAALGDDPNFATTVTNMVAEKADLDHTHTVANITNFGSIKFTGASTGTFSGTNDLTINIPSPTTSLAWSAITGKPSTFAPSSHTHTAAQVTGLADVATSGSYTDLDDKPTLSSFGITATAAELNYVDGVTSNIQTQLNAKAASSHTHSTATKSAAGFLRALNGSTSSYLRGDGSWATPPNTNTTYSLSKSGSTITLTGSDGTTTSVTDSNTTYTLSSFGITATAAELNKLDGLTATTAELNYVDGVTSNIQTQLNGKAASSHSHSASSISGLAKVATSGSYSDLTNKPTIPSLSGYATQSWVNTQLGSYLPKSGGTMTGNITFSSGGVKQTQNATSNYTVAVQWMPGGEAGGQIGCHNTGGDGTGAIILVPYATDTSAWGGSVGLYISKNQVKIDGALLATQSWTNTQLSGKAAASHTHPLSGISDLHSSWDAILKAAPTTHVTSYPSISNVTGKQNLVIKLNSGTSEGTNLFTYNATAAKTVNITASSIGAAASSHTHPLSGISDLHSNWDSILKAAPTIYVTRHPTISEVTSKQNLVIKLNGGSTEGTNMFTYNATGAKTVNITPSAIGAAASSHGTHVSFSSTAPVAPGTASAGSASTVARSDHRHPLQTTVAKLTTARTITFNGDATGSFSFDGSANKTCTLDVTNSTKWNGKSLAIVTELPSSPDANTIYFITD